MAIKLVEVKVDTNINRKTVIVFDPLYEGNGLQEVSHAKTLEDLFPAETLFLGLHYFSLASLREGNIAPGILPTDLVSLNPAVFILDINLIPWFGIHPVMSLLKNLETEKRLCEVKRVIVTDSKVTRQLSQKLARFGILEDAIFSWRAFVSAQEFRNMAKKLV